MLDELDFTKEAANQEIFRNFLRENGLDGDVTAPRVFPEVTTKRVLTMVSFQGISRILFWFRPFVLFLGFVFHTHVIYCMGAGTQSVQWVRRYLRRLM